MGQKYISVESSVFGVNVVQSVITGKNYNRSLKGMQLLKEAMLRLEWAEFLKNKETLKKHRTQLDILVQLKDKLGMAADDSISIFQEFK